MNTFTKNSTVNYIMNKVKMINSSANIIDNTFNKAIFWDMDGSFNQKPVYIFPLKPYLIGLDGCELKNSKMWQNIMFC